MSGFPVAGGDEHTFPDVLDTHYIVRQSTIECARCGRTWIFPEKHVITIGEQVQLLSHAHDCAIESGQRGP